MPIQSRPALLLTRPAAASARFAAALRDRYGDEITVLTAPLMAAERLSPPLPQARPDGVLFTSETGVEALSALVTWRGPALCVGPRTAEVAAQNGWQATAMGGDAEHMLAAFRAEPLKGHWLHARGRHAAAPLAEILSGEGMSVSEAVVYEQRAQTLPTEILEALTSWQGPLVMPVFSPRSARLLREALPALPHQTLWVAAISAAAAREMEPLRAPRVEIAMSPDAPAMLEAIDILLRPTT